MLVIHSAYTNKQVQILYDTRGEKTHCFGKYNPFSIDNQIQKVPTKSTRGSLTTYCMGNQHHQTQNSEIKTHNLVLDSTNRLEF